MNDNWILLSASKAKNFGRAGPRQRDQVSKHIQEDSMKSVETKTEVLR